VFQIGTWVAAQRELSQWTPSQLIVRAKWPTLLGGMFFFITSLAINVCFDHLKVRRLDLFKQSLLA
jgi:hypothetical protein